MKATKRSEIQMSEEDMKARGAVLEAGVVAMCFAAGLTSIAIGIFCDSIGHFFASAAVFVAVGGGISLAIGLGVTVRRR